jgi:hypothetical protein
VKKERKRKIYKDKNGRDYIKETYFIGGKMKFQRIYIIDGVPADEFYEKNATDLDFYLNGDYWLMESDKGSNNHCDGQKKQDSDFSDNKEDLPF